MPKEFQTENIETHNLTTYKQIFRESLGEMLFEKVQRYFNYLFIEDCPNRPLNDRCYIVVARKGFALWIAGMLCELMGQSVPDSRKLISDRNWKKMTVPERIDFINGRDVYIADDSVITGATVQNIYFEVDLRYAKSRSVAFMTSEFSYDYSDMFQTYKDFGSVTTAQRRELNEKILFALYQLAVPYTAESPSYHIPRMLLSDFNKLKTPGNGWDYKYTPLDFGSAGIAQNAFLLQAPLNNCKFGANVLSRGMRVCFREFSEFGENYVDVSFVPWIMFDAINYDKAIKYLLEQIDNYIEIPTESWLYNQLVNGEPSRKQRIVHRVISYLYGICVVDEFEKAFFDGKSIPPFILPNGVEIGSYHFANRLYDEIKLIGGKICDDRNCPSIPLYMDDDEHDKLATALCKMSYYGLDIPKMRLPAIELEDKLCSQREVRVDFETGLPKSRDGMRHPLICYFGDDRSFIVLNCIRRSIASFRSDIVSYKERTYLINTLLPGEGSPLAFVKNYDFIFALHCFTHSKGYSRGKERLFAAKWTKLKDIEPKLSSVSETMLTTLVDMSSAFWPSKKTIMETYKVDPYRGTEDKEVSYSKDALDDIIQVSEKIISEINETVEIEDPIAILSRLPR